MHHVASIAAFKNKFGTYSAAIRNEETKEIIRERFSTYDEARNFAKSKAWELFGPVRFASMPLKGEYRANCWSI